MADQFVTICGPNLRNQSKGEFHVHANDCADLKRDPVIRNSDKWTIKAHSLTFIANEVYSDIIAEHDDDTAEMYLDEFYFAPCVNLPKR